MQDPGFDPGGTALCCFCLLRLSVLLSLMELKEKLISNGPDKSEFTMTCILAMFGKNPSNVFN